MRVYTKKTHCVNGHELTPENRTNGIGQCRICKRINRLRHQEKNPDYRKNWRATHKENLRAEHILSHYGLTKEEYSDMVNIQDNCCGICRQPFDLGDISTTPHVDHNTGKVRELLCRACNSGLGQFRDNKDILLKAVEYLEKHNEQRLGS